MAKAKATPALTGLDLFLRLWERETMTRTTARQVLRVRFSAEEEARIHELMEKNRDGNLTASEQQELDTYVQVWAVLSTLHSRARLLLKKRVRAGAKHG
jgi:hypothetical protein